MFSDERKLSQTIPRNRTFSEPSINLPPSLPPSNAKHSGTIIGEQRVPKGKKEDGEEEKVEEQRVEKASSSAEQQPEADPLSNLRESVEAWRKEYYENAIGNVGNDSLLGHQVKQWRNHLHSELLQSKQDITERLSQYYTTTPSTPLSPMLSRSHSPPSPASPSSNLPWTWHEQFHRSMDSDTASMDEDMEKMRRNLDTQRTFNSVWRKPKL